MKVPGVKSERKKKDTMKNERKQFVSIHIVFNHVV